MKLSKRARPTLLELNMTPMIDVVFNLLIFFMVISSQVSNVQRTKLDLPKLPGAEDQQETTLTVNITSDGSIIVNTETISLTELVSMVSDALDRAGGDVNLVTVVIRADRNGVSRPVNEIVSALTRMQISRVRFAVEVPK
jgi:biopolymer transport protein ExbD